MFTPLEKLFAWFFDKKAPALNVHNEQKTVNNTFNNCNFIAPNPRNANKQINEEP